MLTDLNGHFELAGIAPGTCSLLAAAAGHDGRVFGGVMVPASGEVGPIAIDLAPTAPGEDPKVELTGIGAVLSGKGDALVIGTILSGGGAEKAGIVPGDAVLAVDGVTVVELGFLDAIQRIRGPEGTTVQLRVRKTAGGALVDLAVVRTRIRG